MNLLKTTLKPIIRVFGGILNCQKDIEDSIFSGETCQSGFFVFGELYRAIIYVIGVTAWRILGLALSEVSVLTAFIN